MSCYSPLSLFRDDDGQVIKITSGDISRLAFRGDTLVPVDQMTHADFKNPIKIPCRQCLGCRLDYARSWADRLMIELQDHAQAWFLTLTIDDDHLDQFRAVDPESGELMPWASVDKRTCQLFLKRLRKAQPEPHIMYYLAAEYGDHTFRPHYHAIVFDLILDDLQLWTKRDGFLYWTSVFLDSIWKLGRCIVAKVTPETCAYTARYVLKKAYGRGNASLYEDHGIQREFTLISTKPAIGKKYFEERFLQNKIFGIDNTISLQSESGGIKVRVPKYYDRLMEKVDPDRLLEVKEQRKADSEVFELLKTQRSSKSFIEMLKDEEFNKLSQIRMLRRNLE